MTPRERAVQFVSLQLKTRHQVDELAEQFAEVARAASARMKERVLRAPVPAMPCTCGPEARTPRAGCEYYLGQQSVRDAIHALPLDELVAIIADAEREAAEQMKERVLRAPVPSVPCVCGPSDPNTCAGCGYERGQRSVWDAIHALPLDEKEGT